VYGRKVSISFDSAFLLSLFWFAGFQFLLDLLALLDIHLFGLNIIDNHVFKQLLGLLFLLTFLFVLLSFLLFGFVLALHSLEIVVIALLDGLVILARHQQWNNYK
jgi:hypothetical protein